MCDHTNLKPKSKWYCSYCEVNELNAVINRFRSLVKHLEKQQVDVLPVPFIVKQMTKAIGDPK